MIQYNKGDKFGELTFLKEVDRIRTKSNKTIRAAEFRCFCGNIFIKGLYQVTSFNTTSCGCKENRNYNFEVKGCSYFPEYRVWNNFKNRCSNPNANNYHRYGGRGIKVCDEWLHFEGFYKDMGKRPTKLHSIERIDNDKDYCKDNCKWATREEQNRNRISNKYFNYNGKVLIIKDIMKTKNMTYLAVIRRLNKGISAENIMNSNYKRYERILQI